MKGLKEIVDSLEVKVQKLYELNTALHQELHQVREEKERLQEELMLKSHEYQKMSDRAKILEQNANNHVEHDALKGRIDEVVREVDRCIAMLNN